MQPGQQATLKKDIEIFSDNMKLALKLQAGHIVIFQSAKSVQVPAPSGNFTMSKTMFYCSVVGLPTIIMFGFDPEDLTIGG